MTRRLRFGLLLLLASAVACATSGPQSAATAATATPESIAEELWQAQLRHHPTGATFLGDRRFDALLPDPSEAAHQRWLATLRGLRRAVEALPADVIGQSKLTAEVLSIGLRNRLALEVCQARRWNVDHMSGYPARLPELGSIQIVDSINASGAYLQRVRRAGAVLEAQARNLQAGLDDGFAAPRHIAERAVAQIDAMLARPVVESPWLGVMQRLSGLDEDQTNTFHMLLLAAINDNWRSALRRYREFLTATVLLRSRETVGVGANPDGAACYAARIQHHVGPGLTPEVIHQRGLEELERLQAEMNSLARNNGHTDWRAWVAALDADATQHLDSRQALLEYNLKIVRRAEAALPRAFALLPPISIDVRPIETFREKESPAAYYYAAAEDGSRGAFFLVNTYRPETRPLYNMEALAFHEAVPGHHLQISIAQSLEGLPMLRKRGGFTAFVEGWALYAELVAGELDLYSSDATRFGALNYQAWRAVRLVVDTGLHAHGWDRQRAIDFMRDNLAFPDGEIVNEVDRYIIWPGQALAYMLGRMQIQQLRRRAETSLGERFDLPTFHDRLLENGPLPLELLEPVIDAWIAEAAGS